MKIVDFLVRFINADTKEVTTKSFASDNIITMPIDEFLIKYRNRPLKPKYDPEDDDIAKWAKARDIRCTDKKLEQMKKTLEKEINIKNVIDQDLDENDLLTSQDIGLNIAVAK